MNIEETVLILMNRMMEESWEPEIGEQFVCVHNWLIDVRPELKNLHKLEHSPMFANKTGETSTISG